MTRRSMHMLPRVLQVGRVTRYLNVRDLVSLLMCAQSTGVAAATALFMLCKQGLGGPILKHLLSMDDTEWRTVNLSLIEAVIGIDGSRGTYMPLVWFCEILLCKRTTREIALLVGKKVTLFWDDHGGDFRYDVCLLVVENLVRVGDFEKLRSVCAALQGVPTFDGTGSIYETIASRSTPLELANAICDYMEENKVYMAVNVPFVHIEEWLARSTREEKHRMSFLLRRVSLARYSRKETMRLIESAGKARNVNWLTLLLKSIKIKKLNPTWFQRLPSLSLLDRAHKEWDHEIYKLLREAGAKHSVVYVMRQGGWLSLASNGRSLLDEAMPDIAHGCALSNGYRQYLGAIAAASGNCDALTRLLALGLTETFCCRIGHSPTEWNKFSNPIPLLHLAARCGDTSACMLLIEAFDGPGSSRSDFSKECIERTIENIARSLLDGGVPFTGWGVDNGDASNGTDRDASNGTDRDASNRTDWGAGNGAEHCGSTLWQCTGRNCYYYINDCYGRVSIDNILGCENDPSVRDQESDPLTDSDAEECVDPAIDPSRGRIQESGLSAQWGLRSSVVAEWIAVRAGHVELARRIRAWAAYKRTYKKASISL